VPLTNSTFSNNKPIHHINQFAFASRLAWTLASSTLNSLWNPIWAFPSIWSTFAVTYSKYLPYPISIPSHIPPSRTVTRTRFGKTGITFAYKLGLSYFFLKLGRIKFRIQPNPTQSGLPTGRAPNLISKAPNSRLGWCFKFRAKNCGISIGHTFCPIELKIGVLPI
jgi:hypothetical protein